MKRYDSNILFSVITVFLLASTLPMTSEARAVATKMTCNTKEAKSFWLRHSCLDGFVISERNRVLAQADGLDQYDSRVEIVKETCKDPSSGLFGPVLTRLYSPYSQKYICFTAKGQVRTVHRKRVNKMGKLCAFYEIPINEASRSRSGEAIVYVNLQSAANTNWYLGFGPERPTRGGHRGRSLTPEGYEVLTPRRMTPKASTGSNSHSTHVRTDKCDFKFSTGPYSPNNMFDEFSGISEFLERERNEKLRALQRNTISEAIRENSINDDIDDGDDSSVIFERKRGNQSRLSSQNLFLKAKANSEKVRPDLDKVSDEDDSPPLPSPLALRRRKPNKFRRKSEIRRPSYFYDHNRLREDPGSKAVISDLPVDNLKTPLFSSLA